MVKYNDIDTADHHGWGSGTGNNDYTFPSIPCIPVGKTNSEICTVSGESAAGSNLWNAGSLLSEKCQYLYRNAWDSRDGGNCGGSCAAFVEETDAMVHCRGNHLLYAARTACILRSKDLHGGDDDKQFVTTSRL